MKALREFFIVLLCIALITIVTALGLLLGAKDIFQGAFFGEVAKEMIKVDDNTENAKEINEAIDKVTNYKGTEKVIDSFLEDVSKSGDSIEISDTTYDLLLQALEDNKEEFIKLGASEKEIEEAINEIKNPENRKKMNEKMNEGVQEGLNQGIENPSNNINKNDLRVLKTITSVVSPSTIKKMIISIAVIIALIVLLSFSPYKWIRPVSISAIIAGANLLVCYYAFDSISKMILESGSSIQLDASKLSSMGYPIFFGGIAGLVVYIFVNILAKKNKIDVAEDPKVETKTETEHEIPKPAFNENAGYTKYCALCGSPVGEEDKVCGNCGAPLD